MKCNNCPASWHYEDDGGCKIYNEQKDKNGNEIYGCRFGLKRIEKTIEQYVKEESESYELEG